MIQRTVAERSQVRQVVLNFAALNGVDTCALESLELVIHRLADQGIDLHLSKVKGPVMDRLATSSFLSHLTGRVFLSHYEAMEALAPDVTNNADRSDRPMIDPSQPSPECGPATG